MKKNLFVITAVWVSLCCIVWGGRLNPTDPPGSTMKPLDEVEPRVAVESLTGDAESKYWIREPGSYYLTGNITAEKEHTIKITADNVTLDLMGFRIYASYSETLPPLQIPEDAIFITGNTDNVRIRNGTIQSTDRTGFAGYTYGVYSDDIDNEGLHLEGISVTNCSSIGIYLLTRGSSSIRNCDSSFNGSDGIQAFAAIVEGCGAWENEGDGIEGGSVVRECICRNNTKKGINGGGTVVRCMACYNTEDGIVAGGAVIACIASDNYSNGIKATLYNRIMGNTCQRNNQWGIDAGDYNIIRENVVSLNNGGAIQYGTGCVIGSNIAP